MVRHRRCVDLLSFLLLPFREALLNQLVPQRKVTSQRTFSVALKVSELRSVSVPPWSSMAVLEVYSHGQAWPCTCYPSSLSLDALLEREDA